MANIMDAINEAMRDSNNIQQNNHLLADTQQGVVHNMPKMPARKPGRPPKKRPEIAIADVVGIANAPANAEDLVELAYCNPTAFKKLLSLYKSYGAADICMIFDKDVVKIKTKDHLGKSAIWAKIHCKLLNFYYCKDKIKISIKREYLEKILGSMSKNQYKMMFMLKENYRSKLYIIVKDCQYDKDNTYEVEVSYKPEDQDDDELQENDADYPIKFRVDSKHFKEEINKIKRMSPVLTIQKIGTEPLQFTFDEAKKLNYRGPYNDPEKIKLVSKLEPNDIFNVSVVIDYIKPFSNSSIGDDVYISADKKNKLSLSTFLDKKINEHVIEVKIFTEIREYKRL
jgi:hypothetical protein